MKEVKDSYLFDVLFRFDDFKINEPKTNNIYDTDFIGRVQLLNNESIGHSFSDEEKDLIIMALIIHDGLKSGLKKSEYTVFDHPLQVCQYIVDNKDKLTLNENEIKLITNMISSHMGEWNTNTYSSVVLPKPSNKYQRFVHMCDFLASRKFINVNFENNEIVD